MVNYIYSVFYSLVVFFLVIQFAKVFCESKETPVWIKCLLLIEWSGLMIGLSYISHNIIVRAMVVILATFVHYLILFKTPVSKAIILSIASISLIYIIDFAVYSLKFIIAPEMTINTIFDYTVSYYMSFGSQLLQLITIILISKMFGKTDAMVISTKVWLRYLVVPFASLAFICLVVFTMDSNISEKMGKALILFAMGLVALTLYIYCFMKNDVNREIESEKNRILYRHAEELQTVYNQLSMERDRLAKDNHEFKNLTVAWTKLLNAGEHAKLLKMMEKANSRLLTNSDVLSTGNCTIDVILNAKYFEAISKGISFEFNLSNLTDVRMDDTDLIILVSNVLNNAIEACEKYNQKPEISIKGVMRFNKFLFTVRNTYNGILNDELITTKEEKSLHGFGQEAIKNVVSKYRGNYYIEHDEEFFTIYIVIPM